MAQPTHLSSAVWILNLDFVLDIWLNVDVNLSEVSLSVIASYMVIGEVDHNAFLAIIDGSGNVIKS